MNWGALWSKAMKHWIWGKTALQALKHLHTTAQVQVQNHAWLEKYKNTLFTYVQCHERKRGHWCKQSIVHFSISGIN